MKTKLSILSAFILLVSFLPLKVTSQEISTVAEIFDYNVGDIFHFDENGPNYTIINMEVTEKYFSTEMDTLFYICDLSSQMISPQNPEWTYEYHTETIYYTNLQNPINSGNIDTVYADPLYYNGRQINFFHNSISVDEYWDFSYVNGCGLAISHHEGGPPLSYLKKLVYYKKDFEEWGNPLIVGVEKHSLTECEFNVFPNPAFHHITIEMSKDLLIEEASIYNHLGQKILTTKPENNKVDVLMLKPGIYFIEVATKEWMGKTKFVKQ